MTEFVYVVMYNAITFRVFDNYQTAVIFVTNRKENPKHFRTETDVDGINFSSFGDYKIVRMKLYGEHNTPSAEEISNIKEEIVKLENLIKAKRDLIGDYFS